MKENIQNMQNIQNLQNITEKRDIKFYFNNQLKMKLVLDDKGIVSNILFFDDCNLYSSNTFYYFLKKTLLKDIFSLKDIKNNIFPNDKINSLNSKKSNILENNKKKEEQINENENDIENDENSISSGNSDIGFKEEDFLVALGYIYFKQKPTHIILKTLPSNTFSKNIFESKNLSYQKFIEYLKIDNNNKNKLIVIPITELDHFSLLLVYNFNLYLLDFGLMHSSDDSYTIISNKIENEYIKLKEKLSDEDFNKIDILINNSIKNKNQFQLKEEIINIFGNINEEIVNLIYNYISLEINLCKKFVLDESNCYGDPNTFFNEELYKNIKSINNISIQGTQTCGFFCLASL